MRAFLKRLLGSLGIENVLTAENGWKGLKAVAKWGREIDIVILDMHMDTPINLANLAVL